MHFYDLDSGEINGKIESLSKRQQRLIESTVNYHSLIQPGRTLHYKIYMGEKWQYPRLTDTSTLNGNLTESVNLQPIIEFDATSIVKPQSVFSPHYFVDQEQLVDRNIRYILLTPDEATDADVEANSPKRRLSRIYSQLEVHTPVLLDDLREIQRLRGESKGRKIIASARAQTVDVINKKTGTHHPYLEITPGETTKGSKNAVIIGMHWLQAGGAERWALETVALAKKAGLVPIVITDRDSHQPWITRPEFDDALVLNLTAPLQERPGDATLLRALFEQFTIRGVFIHHCQWLYNWSWWIKKYFPKTPIADSLHIVEYKFAGGYPQESVRYDKWIDIHHVISPQLEKWMSKNHGVDKHKIVVAPLVGLTTQEEESPFQKRQTDEKLTVAFVGRLARQKRLEAFILLASYMNKTQPSKYKFIMHGSGSMDIVRDTLVQRFGLSQAIEFRGNEKSVQETYADSDVLVISSVNEGITLTTIEALRAGIPVISTDVGSQSTIIPPQGLVNRSTRRFVKETARALEHMRKDESQRRKLWMAENTNLNAFTQLEPATSFATQLFEDWKKND